MVIKQSDSRCWIGWRGTGKRGWKMMNLIKNHREHDEPFDLVYTFGFLETGMSDFVSESEGAKVNWMLDLVSALRFKTGEAALEYIRRGPPT